MLSSNDHAIPHMIILKLKDLHTQSLCTPKTIMLKTINNQPTLHHSHQHNPHYSYFAPPATICCSFVCLLDRRRPGASV